MKKKMRFFPDINEIKKVRDYFIEFLKINKIIISDYETFSLELVLGEIAANIIKYGITKEEKSIEFLISYNGNEILFEFVYKGNNISEEKVEKLKKLEVDNDVMNLKESGRGTFIVNSIMDRVEYNEDRGKANVKMYKKI